MWTPPLASSPSPLLWTLSWCPGTLQQGTPHVMWCKWSYQHSYELVVEACDRGEEPCCTNTTIAIDVLDVNDNQPVIENINSSTGCLPVLEV